MIHLIAFLLGIFLYFFVTKPLIILADRKYGISGRVWLDRVLLLFCLVIFILGNVHIVLTVLGKPDITL